MRALQITELTGPDTALSLADLPEPEAVHMISGDRAVVVDVHAAGVEVRSTYLKQASERPGRRPTRFREGWAKWNGTSFAAGLVSGAVAAATEPGRVPARAAAEDYDTDLRLACAEAGTRVLPPLPAAELRALGDLELVCELFARATRTV